MTLSTKKRVMTHPSQRPYNLDDTYDWEGGLTDGDEECLYVPKLWLVGKISPEEFKFLPKIYVGMAQPKYNINYPFILSTWTWKNIDPWWVCWYYN